MVVRVLVVVRVRVIGLAAHPAYGQDQQVDAERAQQQAGQDLGQRHHPFRGSEGPEGEQSAEQQDRGCVRERHDGTELQGLPPGAPLSDQVGRHHGLAVAGSQGVHDAERQ